MTSPTIGNQAKNAAKALNLPIFSLLFSIFSFLTLKYFSNHSHLPNLPKKKDNIPPKLFPIAAIPTHNQILLPIATAPTSNASDEKGNTVDAKKLPKNKPQSPQFSKLIGSYVSCRIEMLIKKCHSFFIDMFYDILLCVSFFIYYN